LGQVLAWVHITFEYSRLVDVALSEFARSMARRKSSDRVFTGKKFFIIIKKKGDANFILMHIHICSETSLFV
jgi:hypothetical protein